MPAQKTRWLDGLRCASAAVAASVMKLEKLIVTDEEKVNRLQEYLENRFSKYGVEKDRDIAKRRRVFYVNVNTKDRFGLSVSDICLQNNPIEHIVNAIENCCISAMQENINCVVKLNENLAISVEAM